MLHAFLLLYFVVLLNLMCCRQVWLARFVVTRLSIVFH